MASERSAYEDRHVREWQAEHLRRLWNELGCPDPATLPGGRMQMGKLHKRAKELAAFEAKHKENGDGSNG